MIENQQNNDGFEIEYAGCFFLLFLVAMLVQIIWLE
jgi:hypothetical protein